MFHQMDLISLDKCLACGSRNIKNVLDLGAQPLANSYKSVKYENEKCFPLSINHCRECFHVQLTHAVNPDLMFKNYLYVSGTSQTMKKYFKWFADFSKEYYQMSNKETRGKITVLDIGCNDGSQLDQYDSAQFQTYGVDPAENLAEVSSRSNKHKIYATYFDYQFYEKADEEFYDIIVAQNVFAHNFSPYEFLSVARKMMKDSSLLFVQTSQADMIRNNEFDTIYHEHISFFNINSMRVLCERAGLNLIDVQKTPLHGNSYIFVMSKSIARPNHIQNLIDMECKDAALLDENTYVKYAEKCKQLITDLVDEISKLRKKGYKIVGYGAAAKGMTLLNYGKINLDFIVDDNPLKQGKFTPGRDIPIVSLDHIRKISETDSVVYIPLAWNFLKEITGKIKSARNNERDIFLTYFPKVELIK